MLITGIAIVALGAGWAIGAYFGHASGMMDAQVLELMQKED